MNQILTFTRAFFICSLVAGFILMGWSATTQTIKAVRGLEITGLAESVWLPIVWVCVSGTAVAVTSIE